MRGATKLNKKETYQINISTHAPLAGRDRGIPQRQCAKTPNFNPRAPCGARPTPPDPLRGHRGFQPTRPLRGATYQDQCVLTLNQFQPTRPLRGATLSSSRCFWSLVYFNPRAPCGARHSRHRCFVITTSFQPTRPLRGATRQQTEKHSRDFISTHAPLAGRDV